MKKRLLVLLFIFSLSLISFSQDVVYVKDLEKIGYYEATGQGESGNSEIPAIRKHEAYTEAKQEALEDSVDFLEGIRNNEERELRTIARENTMLKVVLEETLTEAKVTYREWDEEDNATVKVKIDLKEFKDKLEGIGVE